MTTRTVLMDLAADLARAQVGRPICVQPGCTLPLDHGSAQPHRFDAFDQPPLTGCNLESHRRLVEAVCNIAESIEHELTAESWSGVTRRAYLEMIRDDLRAALAKVTR